MPPLNNITLIHVTTLIGTMLLVPVNASAFAFSDLTDQINSLVFSTEQEPPALPPASILETVKPEILPTVKSDTEHSTDDNIIKPTEEQPPIEVAKPVETPTTETTAPSKIPAEETTETPKTLDAPATIEPIATPEITPPTITSDEKKSEYEKILDKKTAEQAKNTSENAIKPELSSNDVQLKTALEYVYSNHPQIQAQRESLKATDEGVSQAISGFRPNISADLNKGRARRGDASQQWGYNDTKSRGLTATQPLFNGGETLAGYLSAKDRVQAGRAQLSALEQQVLYNAIFAYTDVVEKQAVLELNQKNVDVLKQQLDANKARFNVGDLTLTDVAQSTARLSAAQAAERQALGDFETSKISFKRAIGYDAPEKIALPSIPAGMPSTITEANEWARIANPTLEAAKKLESAAENDVYARSAALLPSVTLQGSMTRSTGNSTSTLARLDSDALTVNLHIPLYQSGAEWSRIREARNVAQQAKFTTLDAHESIVESVTRAWEDYNTAKAIITSNDEAVKAAEIALNGVRKENEFGVRTVLDVLDAEQEAFTARVNLVKAVRAEKIQAYRLLASVGKLTAKDLGLDSDATDPKEHYDSVKYQLLGL